ncbi:class I SAM-dependent methyltransferase [Planctomycetes bacterium K23_9]|uniref:Mg-protoporphyrin IX methyl transferase n=1 Tax=Stieleria marina TaxID=1930275 RepID=A0A517NZ86_9BACT|nr:Mg-protoporphyrin IX methyl transferase [Planctomycetes bacterium K23_9]
MISPKLYRSSHVYDFFMKSLGYQTSIDRFLRSVSVDCPGDAKILDAGCGTGLMGLHFADRFADSTLVATDLEANFLQATLANAKTRGVDKTRISVGTSDISDPTKMTTLDGEVRTLAAESFDVVCVGAVIGYASDTAESLRKLLSLVAPGGMLLNLEMNESFTGKFVSRRYHYDNIPISQMQQVITDAGFQLNVKKFGLRHLPAKFTRTALVARKPLND